MEHLDHETAGSFMEIFCECYSEYVNAIKSLNLQNKSLFQEEVSPYQFLTYHNPFKHRILSNDATVLRELSYLNRRRCVSLDAPNVMSLMMFLSNLCIYAKLATKSFRNLSTEEQVMGENILNRHSQRKLGMVNQGNADENGIWCDIFADLQQDLSGLLVGETEEYLRRELDEVSKQNPSGSVNPLDIIRILTKHNEGGPGEGAPKIDVMSLVNKISERIAVHMQAGKLDEAALIRQSMRLMSHLPNAGQNLQIPQNEPL